MLEHPAAHTPPPTRSESGDSAIGQLLGGRYELQALLGSGASAHVYLAGDRSLGRQVAVKCLRSGLNADERFRRRFRAEAQATARLSHPNLLAVYDWGEDPNAYLVTELLMGGTLLDLLGHSPRLTPSQGLLVALQAAQGLQYAHDFGIVHRDIKPANLLFGEEGRLRIADFGIARAVAEAAWTEPEGVLVGTARYAAPEQALGDAIGDKTDVYSLALTVIEAVTGRVPLLRENALATMVLRQDRDVVEIEELGGLGPALLPAGRADPEARPSAAELIESLTEAARNLPRPERLTLVSPIDLGRGHRSSRSAVGSAGPVASVGSFIDLAATEEAQDSAVVDLADGEDGGDEDAGGVSHDIGEFHEIDDLDDYDVLDEFDDLDVQGFAGGVHAATDPALVSTAHDDGPDPEPTEPGLGLGLDATASYGHEVEHGEAQVIDDGTVPDEKQISIEVTPLSVRDIRRRSGGHEAVESAKDSVEMQPITRPSAQQLRSSSGIRTRVTGEPDPRAGHTVPAAPDTVQDVDLPLEQVLLPERGDVVDAPIKLRDELGNMAASTPASIPASSPTSISASAEAAASESVESVNQSVDQSVDQAVDESVAQSPITRFDLPPTDGTDGPTIDVRDEARGRFGDTGPHVVFDRGHGAAADGAGSALDDDELPMGDGFDDLTIGELVVVDSAGVDGPGVARPQSSSPIDLSEAMEALPSDSLSGGEELPFRSRNETFQTAFVDDPAVTGPHRSSGLVRRWGPSALAGLVALLIVGAAVALLLTSGVLSSDPESAPVEAGSAVVGNYLGLTVPEAQVEAEANGWELTVTERREDGTEAGVITRQLPAAGEQLSEGRTLVIEVSLGAELRTVPRVVGLTVDEAAAVLQRSGLQMGVVSDRNDDQVEEGRVLSARVEGADAADQVETGTSVDLVVSAGPASAAMPSFVGLTLEAALTQADELGLIVTQAEAASETYDQGFVVDTTPPTNTLVTAGDQLTLVVSTGAPFIEVPNVVGLTPAEAADALADAGFIVSDTDGPPNQPVTGTSPGAGVAHRKGDDVVIETASS